MGLVSLFVNILMLTVPLYMLQIFDRVLASRSVETLVFLTIAAVGALIVYGVLDLLRGHVMIGVGTWLEKKLGPEALDRAVEAQLSQRVYGVQSLRDVSQIRQFLSSPTIFFLFDVPWVPVYLTVIYLLHPLLGNIALIAAVLLFIVALINEFATRRPLKVANENSLTTLRQTEAAIRNAHVIEAMGLMPGVLKRWLSGNDESLRQLQIGSERGGILSSGSKSMRLIVQALILGAGAYLVIHSEITPGTMIAGSIILSRALQPVEAAIGTWKQLLASRASYMRLSYFFSEPPVRVSEIRLPEPEGYLSAEEVTFIPPGGTRPAIISVSFRLDPAEILAIIGPSAAGKSTLARLMVGSWKPFSGSVRLDGADVFTWERKDFGRHVGYMPQEIELFEGTVAENIARLNDVDENLIVEAAQKAGAHEMILRLPDGYRTHVGEGGQMLSGGQRQRGGACPRAVRVSAPDRPRRAQQQLGQ